MDKRWILILIILIVGCSCMYLVVDSSSTVGTAITVVNKTVVKLPHDFSIGEGEKDTAELINKNSNEKIYITDLGKKDIALESFKNALDTLKDNSKIKITDNSTSKINNISTYKISVQNYTDDNAKNSTFAYIYSCNHTFLIKMEDYSNIDKLNDDLDFIVGTMTPDFKQSQD